MDSEERGARRVGVTLGVMITVFLVLAVLGIILLLAL